MKGALHEGMQDIRWGRLSWTYLCAFVTVVEDLIED